MTKEEAKEIFLNREYVEVDCGTVYDTNKWKEACRVISEWLKQQPCEDCISRWKVLDMSDFVGEIPTYSNPHGTLEEVVHVEDIESLPSVTPVRKKGKWIKRENIHGLEQYYQCSNCGNHCLYDYVEIGFKNTKTKYCPHCGAEMEK